MSIYGWSTNENSNQTVGNINFAEGQAASTVNNSAREAMAVIAKLLLDTSGALTSGAVDPGEQFVGAMTLTTNNVIDSNRDGILLVFRAGNSAAAAATLNVDGQGARNLARPDGTNISQGDIVAGQIVMVAYDDTGADSWIVLNPSSTVYSTDPPPFTSSLFVDVLGGTTNNPAVSQVDGVTVNTTGFISAYHDDGISLYLGREDDGSIASWNYNGSNIGGITFSGSGTQVNYTTSSDYRLKDDVRALGAGDAWRKINGLAPSGYTWKSNGKAGEGFIAHDFATVFPCSVQGDKDGSEMQAMQASSSEVIANIVRCLQDIDVRLKRLEGVLPTLPDPSEAPPRIDPSESVVRPRRGAPRRGSVLPR